MVQPIEERLKEKGWSQEEINKAANILHGSEDPGKIYFSKKMNPILYWLVLILAIVASMVISVVLIPFMLAVESTIGLYSIIALLALSFGFFFRLLLTEIEYVDPKHHVIAGVFIPALAIINIVIVINVTTVIDKIFFGARFSQNVVAIGIIYVVSFVAPYLITKLMEHFSTQKRMAQNL